MIGGSKPGFEIHTFTVEELETMYEVVEEKYLENKIHDMARQVICNQSNTEDNDVLEKSESMS